MYNTKIKEFLANFQIFLAKYFIYLSETIKKMDKTHAVTALQNAVAFLKGQKIIKKEIEISTENRVYRCPLHRFTTGGLCT